MFYLKKNLPTWERRLRVALGLATTLAAASFALTDHTPFWIGALGMACGGMLALTGFVGFCPACAMAGRKLGPPR